MPVSFSSPTEIIDHPKPPRPGGGDGSAGGRRPPEDTHYTGGGGDGDDWKRRNDGYRGHRENLYRHRLSLFAILLGDAMFFVATISVFLISKAHYHVNAYGMVVSEWHAIAVPPILVLNTALLLLSSLTMEIARRGIFYEHDVLEEWLGMGRPATKRVLPWLSMTILLGVAFLCGQMLAWKQITAIPHLHVDPSRQDFYLLTGLHAAHILIGLLALAFSILAIPLLRKVEWKQILVDCTGWFWHTMGLFWIVLFVLIEWCQ